MGTINRDAYPLEDRSGANERRIVPYTGPASYATGGDSLTPQSIKLSKIGALVGLIISNGTAILWGYYNQTSQKILWYSATGTEVTNATDLSAYSGRFEAIGK